MHGWFDAAFPVTSDILLILRSGGMLDSEIEFENNLIGSIYDCALNPSQWSETMQSVCSSLEGHSAGIVLLDYAGHNDRLVRDWGPTKVWGDRIAEVLESIKRIHRQFLGIQSPRSEDLILLPRDLAPQIEVFSTPFYLYWAKPQNIHQVVEAIALSEPTRLGLFCVTRHADAGEFTGDQLARLRRLAPHIRRAITISDVLDLKTVERQAYREVIDSMAAGICIVGHRGAILHANTAAKSMMQDAILIRSENGQLRGSDSEGTSELMAAIDAAHVNGRSLGANGIGVPLKGSGGQRAVAHVLPLACGDIRTRLTPDALAGVFISSGEAPRFEDLDAIGRCFEFTPAETRLVAELRTGKSLVDCARTLGVAEVTARTHLQNIFAKSGVSRQVDLLTLIGRLVPVTRTSDLS